MTAPTWPVAPTIPTFMDATVSFLSVRATKVSDAAELMMSFGRGDRHADGAPDDGTHGRVFAAGVFADELHLQQAGIIIDADNQMGAGVIASDMFAGHAGDDAKRRSCVRGDGPNPWFSSGCDVIGPPTPCLQACEGVPDVLVAEVPDGVIEAGHSSRSTAGTSEAFPDRRPSSLSQSGHRIVVGQGQYRKWCEHHAHSEAWRTPFSSTVLEWSGISPPLSHTGLGHSPRSISTSVA